MKKSIAQIVPFNTPWDNTLSDSFGLGIMPFGDIENPRMTSNYYRTVTYSPRYYQEELRQCRYFYRYDPLASTVINRMCEIAVSDLHNRRMGCTDQEMYYFNAISKKLTPLLESIAAEYLIAGMAIPDYVKDKIMGSKLDPRLGRTRYTYPKTFWVRNPENIIVRRKPVTLDRAVYLQVPSDEVYFIQNNGEYKDGTKDTELFDRVKQQFPEYVARIQAGSTNIPLPDSRPIFRKLMPSQDYPQPYLVPALSALKHKMQIKRMDFSIANKMLGAIRQVSVGDKDDPVEEDDGRLEQTRDQMSTQSEGNDHIYTLYTDHTVMIKWIYPPLDALLSETKYAEPNADIFFAFGFSKVLLIGESGRSNTGSENSSMLGPLATLRELRRAVLTWVYELYQELADDNGFTNIPEPDFNLISTGDLASLATFAIQAVQQKVISKDSIAQLLGSSYEREREQIDAERVADGLPKLSEENKITTKNNQVIMDQQIQRTEQQITQQTTQQPAKQQSEPPTSGG